MSKKLSRILATVMLALAITFVLFARNYHLSLVKRIPIYAYLSKNKKP